MATCATAVLPVIVTDFCNPSIAFGQIKEVFITRAGDADVLTDVTDLDEWTSRIDNDAVIPGSGAAPIRRLPGIGSLAPGTRTETDISLGRKVYGKPVNVLNFKVDETNKENVDAARDWQENPGAQARIWFRTDAQIFGGNGGIIVTINPNLDIPEDKAQVVTLPFAFNWEGFIPEVDENPFA